MGDGSGENKGNEMSRAQDGRRKTAGDTEAHSAGNATSSGLSSAHKVKVIINGEERLVSRQRRWQIRNRAAGKCAHCTAPEAGHGYCEKHHAQRIEFWRQRYHRKVSTRGEE